MQCPQCGAAPTDGARFCEACGASLAPQAIATPAAAERCRCGAGPEAKGDDGFCSACGLRWPPPAREPLPRDHIETALSPGFAAVTDRGRRHSCNEDAVALAREGAPGRAPCAIIVVCDGVSSSQRADEASAAAAATACASLQGALGAGDGATDTAAALRAAIRAAHTAACALPSASDAVKGPPGTTVVAAVVRDAGATLAWLGDSRAYWIGPDDARLLTHDHSWVNEVVDAGEMTEEEALRSPEAHAITRCLGPLNDETPEPTLVTVPLPAPGRLLLCTDGLWNYAPGTEQIAALVRQAPAGADAQGVCRHLVDYALSRGGRDNITVALLTIVEGEDF